jgi:uncharacterized protein with PIN domain
MGLAIGENDNYDKQKQNYADFNSYAESLNRTVPDRTSTIEEKEAAIKVKKRIMEHPQCSKEMQRTLQGEIDTIQGEIDAMERENAMNTSVFGKRQLE